MADGDEQYKLIRSRMREFCVHDLKLKKVIYLSLVFMPQKRVKNRKIIISMRPAPSER